MYSGPHSVSGQWFRSLSSGKFVLVLGFCIVTSHSVGILLLSVNAYLLLRREKYSVSITNTHNCSSIYMNFELVHFS